MTTRNLDRTLSRLTKRLLEARQKEGHWTGELSDSALSTATAVMALHLADNRDPLIASGMNWLERAQNTDGGFGDTIDSRSNISTTALCWAAFELTGCMNAAKDRTVEWMRRAAGGLQPEMLVRALGQRYGIDRTFSVPILTVLAVAGIVPWHMVPQLPFELAACPKSWFARLGLPVVSYALPALIAIGQARHRKKPSRNPATRVFRNLASDRTLCILEQIQPVNGGYLEATPLTSFVCISLLAAGLNRSPVVARGIGFLRQSVRAHGSWPIDTNIATWLTTLSVNALQGRLPEEDRNSIAVWLLSQQYHDVHPYTGAPPGGWAWTDLPGGVPDADDTAGALVALDTLGMHDSEVVAAATSGVHWLLGLQNRDGGIPTFCRGWGKLPFDRSSCDITAHAIQAWAIWKPHLHANDQARVDTAIAQAVKFLEEAQRSDGAWIPLWFGNQLAAREENPVYGTARVILGMHRAGIESTAIQRAVCWMIASQNSDGGWGGEMGVPSSIEETSLAVSALSNLPDRSSQVAAYAGAEWLARSTCGGETTTPAPIGLYFARLWYSESLYPLIFATDALRRIAKITILPRQ